MNAKAEAIAATALGTFASLALWFVLASRVGGMGGAIALLLTAFGIDAVAGVFIAGRLRTSWTTVFPGLLLGASVANFVWMMFVYDPH